MNIDKNKKKKELVLKMIKEIAEFTRNFEKVPDIQKDVNISKLILKGLLKEAFDFEFLIRSINNILHEAKGKSIAFWTSIVKIIKRYFDEVNKLKT